MLVQVAIFITLVAVATAAPAQFVYTAGQYGAPLTYSAAGPLPSSSFISYRPQSRPNYVVEPQFPTPSIYTAPAAVVPGSVVPSAVIPTIYNAGNPYNTFPSSHLAASSGIPTTYNNVPSLFTYNAQTQGSQHIVY